MRKISRRRFMEDAALLLAAASLPGKAWGQESGSAGKKVGANEKINIGVIGINGRGLAHVRAYAGMADVNVVALCDADTAVFERSVNAIIGADKPEPKTYQDVRKMLENKDIDAVSIATPNHWHALGAIWAMQSGKDVYVEKPVCHNVFEGRKMVEAARKYKRICVSGTQSRSNPGMIQGIQYLHDGKLGKIKLARGLCYKRRDSIGRVILPQNPPETVDYSLWSGPAPIEPLMRGRFHYDWHWQFLYGNGDQGNQGAHELDKARWGLNKKSHPISVMTFGGRFGYWDNGDTPNTQVSVFDYGDVQIIFETRGLPTEGLLGAGIGNIWYGTEGYMVAPSYSRCIVYDNDGNKVEEFGGGADHFRNFIDGLRSRKISDLNCDIEDGFISSALCGLSDASYKLGKRIPLSSKPDFVGDKDVEDSYRRMMEHLKANGVDGKNWELTVGPKLKFDPRRELFVDNDAANRFLTRPYRAPFVVPDRV